MYCSAECRERMIDRFALTHLDHLLQPDEDDQNLNQGKEGDAGHRRTAPQTFARTIYRDGDPPT